MISRSRHRSNLEALLRMLRRRLPILLAATLLVPAAAYAWSESQERVYTASTTLLFRDPGLDQKLFGSSGVAPFQDPQRQAATNVQLVELDVVSRRTATEFPGLTGDEVRSKVSAAPLGQSDLVAVNADDNDPRRAAALANAFAEQFIAYRRAADRSKIRGAREVVSRGLADLDPAERNGPIARSLRERASTLDILASLQTGNVELAQSATPPGSPSSPRVRRNVAVGLLLGLLLGIALAVGFERIDRRLKDSESVEEIFARPVLGGIPESGTLSHAGLTPGSLRSAESEAFRMLRANLRYFNVNREIRTVLITSAASGEGKSTVAWNLAGAAAMSGESVLLLEADLRHPKVAKALEIDPRRGVTSVVARQVALDDAISSLVIDERPGRVVTMDVLPAGPVPPNATDIVESDALRDVLSTVRDRYDLVVIDTAPMSIVSDAVPLMHRVDGVIIVSRLYASRRDAATRMRDQLANLDVSVLGIVLNSVTPEEGYYGYGYGYTYGDANGRRRRGRRGREAPPLLDESQERERVDA